MCELETYLQRSELIFLSDADKELIRRYVKRYVSFYPVGRLLALVLMKLNKPSVSQEFINWLYYY